MKPKRKPQYKVYKITLAVFFFLSLICVSGSFATKNSFKNPIPFNAGSEIGYPPFCVVDSDGQVNGFSVELMRAALKAMGQEATFRTGPWADVKGWLEQGKIQALPLVGRTPEREFIFDFTFPYMSFHGAIVVRKDTTDIHDIADLRSRQVAVMKGDNAEEFVRRKDHGFKIHTTITFEDALRELSDGLHDAVIIQRLVALRLIQKAGLTKLKVLNNPITGYRQDWCFAVREGDRDTLSLLNEGLALVMADGTYSHLHSKWFAALDLPSNRRIVIGGDINYPPFEYMDKNGLSKFLTVVATQEKALRELAKGQYDCALVARISAMYFIKHFGWENLVIGKHSILSAEYCYAVPKDKKVLLSQLSEGMKILEESGEYRQIHENLY